MKKIVILLVFLLVLLVFGLIPKLALPQDIPLPPDIEIVAPAPDLAKEIAAFSGKWKGVWDGAGLEAILIVEEIDNNQAKIIYAWGEGLRDRKGYLQVIAKVIPGSKPKIEFGRKSNDSEVKFTFEMKKDLKSIKGIREIHSRWGNFYYSIKMKKVD